jgi:DNA polymerase-4
VLTHAQARERFAAAAPGLLPGIGPKTARRLAARGVHSIATLAATADDVLAEWFGPRLGPWLGQLARFEDDSPVVPVHTPKSESRETTFDYDIHMLAELESILDRLAEELCASLATDDRRGRTISIKIRLDNFSTHTRSRTINDPTNELAVVREISRELLRAFEPARPVRLLGVRVASFVSPSTRAVAQLPLSAPTEPTRATRPAEAPTARCGFPPDP